MTDSNYFSISEASVALEARAASMASNSWQQHTTVTGLVSAMTDYVYSPNTILVFNHAGVWNPITKRINIMGKYHGASSNIQHARYDAASDSFLSTINTGIDGGHGYDHVTCNPTTGDLYYVHYFGVSVGQIPVWRSVSEGTFQELSGEPTVGGNITWGTCWWTGSVTGAGAQGALVVYECTGTGQMYLYDPVGNTWTTHTTSIYGSISGSTYHEVAEYSAVHNVVVCGGGNVLGNRLFRVDSSGASLEMPNAPFSVGSSNASGQANLCVDPVSGNFLVFGINGNDQLWELDPSGSGSWTQLANMPSGAGSERLVCPIPEYGVVALLATDNIAANNAGMWLYKR